MIKITRGNSTCNYDNSRAVQTVTQVIKNDPEAAHDLKVQGSLLELLNFFQALHKKSNIIKAIKEAK